MFLLESIFLLIVIGRFNTVGVTRFMDTNEMGEKTIVQTPTQSRKVCFRGE